MPQAGIPCAVGTSAYAEIGAYRTNPADALPASCLRKPATGSFYAVIGIAFPATPIFSFQKRNRKKGR